MPRSYASDLLVDDIDLDGERVAGRPYRSGRRRSDVFMVFVAAAASAAVLFNAFALQQGRNGSRAAAPASAQSDIRAIPAPQAATPAPAAPAAAPPAAMAPADPVAALANAPAVATPLPPSRPAAPPRPAAAAPSPAISAPVALTNTPAAGLLPPGEVPVSPRVMAVQKALSQLGYGPVRVDGRLGAATEEAVQRFERDRRLPVTGQISDRVVREINAVAGLSIP
ncbi:peptidoglycan-binding protein [Ancylobacter sp. TS-1]|uniref:peptidoglycan-binding domain-containing protein n=1 Tax=Ancylobacter sp. TS-1 TaxID=1850374 RepID=UPI001265AF82|nr:peptidoglycan-binding domain-containing protein [Ancylobacter sp. TS-1]QFR31691.1 peptidoglycan-binding protein [Ancylobacter sp. TS-1]